MKRLWILLALLLAVSVGLNVWQCRGGRAAGEAAGDTVRVTYTDTVAYYAPVARESVVVRYVTVRLAVARDSGEMGRISPIGGMGDDSLLVSVPIGQKRYGDSTYTAWVSGYEAKLDSIFVYPRREVITVTRTERREKRWGVGVQAGLGFAGRDVRPYVGVGVSYRLFEW